MKQITIYDLIPLLKDGWVAFDNCNWWWYSAKPKVLKRYKTWRVTKGFYVRLNTFEMKDIAPFVGDWRDSLIKVVDYQKDTNKLADPKTKKRVYKKEEV